ncbi:MAG: hypothetical protein Q9191_007517 [Dirinaria sp. TL-2023a]
MDSIYSFAWYAESWIEVSSRPSSSSLSSAATDDVVPSAFRALHDQRRRPRLNRTVSLPSGTQVRSTSATGSSQEEYEESESESDRIMTSSNEALEQHSSEGVSPSAQVSSASERGDDQDDDDDENATALGVATVEPAFTPQPNAFSHPPRSPRHTHSAETRTSYFSPTPRTTPSRRTARSYPTQRSRSHTPYNVISPSHQADHDAALRASLSTLLSCAAAARGLPKREQAPVLPPRPAAAPANRVEPSTLRIVPESVVMGETPEPPRPSARKRSASGSRGASGSEKGKRKASTSRNRREARKKQKASIEDLNISPTLMTWVVSAGVVVLFSAISFSAGYVVGREVGRMEAASAATGNQGVVCSKEVGRGLRKLRWGTSSTVIRV